MGPRALPREVPQGRRERREGEDAVGTSGGNLMKLIVKFNLVFLLIFAVGLSVAAVISRDLLERNARDEVLQNARFMMESALASRTYTSTQVGPLLATQMKYEFRPQSVPAYAATEQLNDVRKKFADYNYKEATLNPTNPRDRVTDWEGDIVNQLRQNPERTEIIGERDTLTGPSLYLARPIKRSKDTFNVFMISLTGVFVFIFIALNLMLYFIVIHPVRKLSQVADQVSLGTLDAPGFAVKGKDEIAALAGSFERMRTSLVQAMKMLGE